MKTIPLTQFELKKVSIVDDEDYPILSRFAWQYMENKGCESVYCAFTGFRQSKFKLLMHQMIMPALFGKYAHHRDGNTLNNQKSNITFVSNNFRRHLGKRQNTFSSRYRGVHWCTRDNEWIATITCYSTGLKNKQLYRGHDEKKAAIAYNEKARELYGELAYQNVIIE